MRCDLFSYDRGEARKLLDDGTLDDAVQHNAKKVLWQRLANEIVQDRELLENAPPSKIIALAREWVPTQYPGAKVTHSSAHRYPLIIDDEVLQNLLALPMPVEHEYSEAATHTIKVCDLRVDDDDDSDDERFMSSSSSDNDDDDDDDESMSEVSSEEEYDDDGYGGWFWIGAFWLVGLWFDEGNAATEEVCSRECHGGGGGGGGREIEEEEEEEEGEEGGGEERRFLFWLTKMSFGCGHSDVEHMAM